MAGDRRWRRHLRPALVGVVAALGAYAAIAAGVSLPQGERPRLSQLVWSSLAAITAGGLAYFQVRKDEAWPGPSPAGSQAREATVDPAEELPPQAVPCQLPPGIGDFTDRELVLRQVRALFAPTSHRSGAPTVVAIAGKPGIGKTALAIHLAHQLRPWFPDGQLYVNLRSADAERLDPGVVLAEFLRALGVGGNAIPDGVEARSALYRERLAGRRVLVVLDNAAEPAQVRPLLPGERLCGVVITSRARFSSLEGARIVALDVLDPDEAVELLAKVAGHDRLGAEAESAREVVRLCGYLPLAVRIAGAKLAARPHLSTGQLARRLSDERRRLTELKVGDLEVRTPFDLSYQELAPTERRLFRLLGLLESADLTAWLAAALLDTSTAEAEELIESLVDAQLLDADTDDTGTARYEMHDLLRLFARERLGEEDPEEVQRAALERALGAYLTLAVEADDALEPRSRAETYTPRAPRWLPDDGADVLAQVRQDPARWFRIERANLVDAVEQAFDAGLFAHAWELAETLTAWFAWQTRWDDWRDANELALRAARRVDDRPAEAVGLLSRWWYLGNQGRWEEAVAAAEGALAIFDELGDRLGRAHARRDMGVVLRYLGRWDEAVEGLTSGIAVFRELGKPHDVGVAQRTLGDVYRDLHRFDEAVICLRDAITVFRDVGDPRWEAISLRSLGEVYRDQGNTEAAVDSFQRCLTMLRELDGRREEAMALRALGATYRDQGHLDEAAEILTECLLVFQELGERRWEAAARQNLGEVRCEQSRWEDAEACFRTALPIFRKLGEGPWEARTLRGLARALDGKGDHAGAEEARRAADLVSGGLKPG